MSEAKKQQTNLKKVKRSSTIEISVIFPCLNEAETVATCVRRAKKWIGKKSGEVIVVDNGSSDDSVRLARRAGARVIHEKHSGYGAAISRGLSAAHGIFLIIADADLSYDVLHLSAFVQQLKAGNDIVIGNRFSGKMDPNAMPWLHQYVGNPLLTFVANVFFGTKIHDYHSGVRAVKKSIVAPLGLRCSGMEFASEMIVRAKLQGLSIAEVPVPYFKDGRTRKSHMRTFRDGWRHLRFLMLFAPNWIFFFPAIAILSSSVSLLMWMIIDSLQVGRVHFGIHTMLVAGAATIIGYQLFHWSLCVSIFARRAQLPMKSVPVIEAISRIGLEPMMGVGVFVISAGAALCVWTFKVWVREHFGDLHPEETMRVFIPGVLFVLLGMQMVFSSLFLGILQFDDPRQKD